MHTSNNYYKHFKPYHIRLREYNSARERIFGAEELIRKVPKRSTLRLRKFWKSVLDNRNLICSAIINDIPASDIRPYATIELFGEKVSGLIDTGATVSCIASDLARKILFENKQKFKRFRVNINTADGTPHIALAKLKTFITFRGVTKQVDFLIIPTLSQNMYLGVDFVRTFGLASDLFEDSKILGVVNELNDCSLIGTLNPSQLGLLKSAIAMFPSYSKEGLGRTSLVTHVIDVGSSKPIKQRFFAVSPAIEKMLFEEIDRMLALGVIEESQSAWSSPVTLVVKPGKVRMCIDARKLNSVTVGDAYPLPLIDGILSRLPKAKYITSLDLKDAFWQVPLDEGSRDKTAFTVPNRPLYQFVTMPFGLCNSAQTMCRLMDKTIPAHLRNRVFIYLDDLLLITETFEEHLALLREVSCCIRRAGLTINVEKSKFLMSEVRYLGHIIGHGTIKVDSDKVIAIESFPLPKTVKQLRRFLGMCGWYRRFLKDYASMTTPLTDMLRKSRSFVWSNEGILAFEKLKSSLVSAPVLHSPDFKRPFSIQCDASSYGVGAVLVQRSDEGDEVPIAYMSHKFNAAQRNYTVSEQECLAAVLAIRKFRAYVEGMEF